MSDVRCLSSEICINNVSRMLKSGIRATFFVFLHLYVKKCLFCLREKSKLSLLYIVVFFIPLEHDLMLKANIVMNSDTPPYC